MTFLSPQRFLATVVILAPVLIHLLVHRRAERLVFPTLRFIAPSRLASMRRRMLDDVPLLAVRIAVFVAAVGALAAPLVVTSARQRRVEREGGHRDGAGRESAQRTEARGRRAREGTAGATRNRRLVRVPSRIADGRGRRRRARVDRASLRTNRRSAGDANRRRRARAHRGDTQIARELTFAARAPAFVRSRSPIARPSLSKLTHRPMRSLRSTRRSPPCCRSACGRRPRIGGRGWSSAP